MHKKGFELSFQAIVVGILALLALAVLAYVFTTQVGKSTAQYGQITQTLSLERCQQFGSSRVCRPNCETDASKTPPQNFRRISPPPPKAASAATPGQPAAPPSTGGWNDCSAPNSECCEPI